MIYIHALNQGLHYHTIDIATATAKDFNWHLKLTTEATSEDSIVTVLEMPQEMALRLFWWYTSKEASEELVTHLDALLNHDKMKQDIIDTFHWSVIRLVADVTMSFVSGRLILSDESYMAYECQNYIEEGYGNELYAFLDAKGFEKIVEVVA